MDITDILNNIVSTFFDGEAMLRTLPDMLAYGLLNTLILAVLSTIFGVVLGLALAVMGVSRRRLPRVLSRVYTDVFRGLPAILTILLVGTGLAPLINPLTHGNPYPLGIFALSLISSAYIGEIFRGGILAIETGQLEASRALGMTHGSAMWQIVIPQGIRQVLPSLVNQFIAIVKDSSLVYFLGLITTQRELFRIGQDSAITTGNLSPLVLAGVFYLAITVPLTHLVNYIDVRLKRGRRATAVEPPTSTGPTPTGPSSPVPTAEPIVRA